MKYYVAGGTLAFISAVALLIVMTVIEPARMESFTRSYESRQIEQCALIFESNCLRCHGPMEVTRIRARSSWFCPRCQV